MSIFFDFDVGPPGRRFRRAVCDDKADIEVFIDSGSVKMFKPVNIGSLIELSALSICMINEKKEIIGFMALNDYPSVDGVDPADWELWIRNMYQRYYLSRNTLFIHFMCCKKSVMHCFFEEALVSVFENDVYLMQIVLFVSPECTQENLSRYNNYRKRYLNRYPPKRDEDTENKQYLYAALRQDYCPKLKIRRAVEEDNDDIVEILDKKSPRFKELYGEYYISEILAYNPESKRNIIVAEHQDKAIGVMCLSSVINYKKLHSTYEMRPYFGLRKPTPVEKESLKRDNKLLSTFGGPIMCGQVSPYNKLRYGPSGDEEPKLLSDVSKDNISQDNFSTKTITDVNLKRVVIKPERRHSSNGHSSYRSSEEFVDLVICQSSMLNETTHILDDDDDDCDYDIVNIDVLSVMNLLPVERCSYISYDNKDLGTSRSIAAFGRTSKFINLTEQDSVTDTIANHSKMYLGRRSFIKFDADVYEYEGEPNAFMIELFGLHEKVHERRGFDLLEVAFEIMKDFDYCIIRVPTVDTSFPLLQHFTLVPTKARICCVYSLYVAHRSSVLGKMRVRPAEITDIPLLTQLFQNLQSKETFRTIEHSMYGVDKLDHQAFVFMSGLSLIGCAVIEPPEKLTYLRAKFNLDPYHNHKFHHTGASVKVGFTSVMCCTVNPVFETHFRFFARDIMRLSGSHCLVWMTAYRNRWVAHKANCLVASMVPMLPRKSNFTDDPELMKLTKLSNNILPFCTWFLDKKLTSVPIVNVGCKIVIIGSSRTAMAFLNTLLFGTSCTYLAFTDITIISPTGLPFKRTYNKAAEMMFPIFHNNTDNYLKSVPYSYYVNVVQGTMMEIHKADKYITLTTGSRFQYDMLFLFVGKQYQHPNYLKELYEQDLKEQTYSRLDIPRASFEPEVLTHDTPDNVFIINNIGEADKALKYLTKYHKEFGDTQIIVYGATIDTYCCIAALLESNIPASRITFVEPFPSENPKKMRISPFYNSYVDETITHVLENLGLKVCRKHYFQSWQINDNYVTHVNFLTDFQIVTMECTAFFYFGRRGVNVEAFFAVNKAGIAYDAGVLIDHEFRTKDPHIYAVGPVTAYYKKYYAPDMKQKYYDSYDVGEKLGTQIKNMLDPLFEAKTTAKSSKTQSKNASIFDSWSSSSTSTNSSQSSMEYEFTRSRLPKLQKPKVICCKLPGGLQFLQVRSPGKKIPHYYLQTLHYSGYVMETFKSGYFKIHMNNDLIVDGITCLTPATFTVENFKNLYGKSSVCLNNVCLRYSTKKLDNFYEFFRAPWAIYLYHDQADELFAMVKELLPKGQNKGETITEAMLSNVTVATNETDMKLELRKKCDVSPYLDTITDYVIEWISENDIVLPMYLQPALSAVYRHDNDRNPCFKKKKITFNKILSIIVKNK